MSNVFRKSLALKLLSLFVGFLLVLLLLELATQSPSNKLRQLSEWWSYSSVKSIKGVISYNTGFSLKCSDGYHKMAIQTAEYGVFYASFLDDDLGVSTEHSKTLQNKNITIFFEKDLYSSIVYDPGAYSNLQNLSSAEHEYLNRSNRSHLPSDTSGSFFEQLRKRLIDVSSETEKPYTGGTVKAGNYKINIRNIEKIQIEGVQNAEIFLKQRTESC